MDFSTSMADARVAGPRDAFATLTGDGGCDRVRVGGEVSVLRLAGRILAEKVTGQVGLAAIENAWTREVWRGARQSGRFWIVPVTSGRRNSGVDHRRREQRAMTKEAFLATHKALRA